MVGICLVAAFVVSAIAAASASALEIVKKGSSTFINCPVDATEAEGKPVEEIFCVYANTEAGVGGGHYRVGNITVPLLRSVKLQYGIAFSEGFSHEGFAPPINGVEAITPTPEKVPGEPIAHISTAEQEELGWPEALKTRYREGQKAGTVKVVFETIELAGTPATSRSNLISGEGPGVTAPVKVKGENRWLSQLGDVCYIGSQEDPIVQHLTTGKSTSPLTGETISGAFGELQFGHEFNWLAITHDVLVDNTYPVPGASCTGPYSAVIAATIDKIFGIPAVAGASLTELKGTLYNATAPWVEGEIKK
jgi:hypothetical protein